MGFLVLAALVARPIFHYVRNSLRPGNVFHPNVAFAPNAAPASKPTTDWPLFGYTKDHARFFAAGPALSPPLHTQWVHAGSALLEFPPVVSNGRLFQLDDSGNVHALDAATGRLIWQRQVGQLAASSPAAGGDTIYVTLLHAKPGPGAIVALDERTGRTRWSRALPSPSESSPLLDRGILYFGSQEGIVYALRAQDGRVLWAYHAKGSVKASPTFDDGNLYFGDYGGYMQALQESDGRLVWSTGSRGSFGGGNFYATAALAFGRVYAGNTDGRVYAYDAGSGKLAWAHQTGDYVYSSPAVADAPNVGPTIYIGSYDGRFYALNAYNGSPRWVFNAHGKISGSPSIIGRIVYFADLGTHITYGLDIATGGLRYERHTGSFDPVISDGTRIFLSGITGLYGLIPYRPVQTAISLAPSWTPAALAARRTVLRGELCAPDPLVPRAPYC